MKNYIDVEGAKEDLSKMNEEERSDTMKAAIGTMLVSQMKDFDQLDEAEMVEMTNAIVIISIIASKEGD